MCFLAKTTEEATLKIATKNIRVYKAISREGNGWLYSLWINNEREKWTPGFHYTEPDFSKKALNKRIVGEGYFVDGNAFHSKKTLDSVRKMSHDHNDIIVEMYIPRGARYYENNEEYVSSSLVYPENPIIHHFM